MNKNAYDLLFKNEEKRTEIILSLEAYYNKIIAEIEGEWKKTGEIVTNDEHNEIAKQYLTKLQIVNKELRDVPKGDSDDYGKDVDRLLKLEEINYKTTIKVFIEKLACFDLIKKDMDDSAIILKEKEIAGIINEKTYIREEINDLITTLKYQYK